VVYLAMPFGREAVLKAVRLGLQWHRMSMAVRARRRRTRPIPSRPGSRLPRGLNTSSGDRAHPKGRRSSASTNRRGLSRLGRGRAVANRSGEDDGARRGVMARRHPPGQTPFQRPRTRFRAVPA
jgi:hypothetical protein